MSSFCHTDRGLISGNRNEELNRTICHGTDFKNIQY